MEKQRATEILMEALCLSVPHDLAFVLEVHKDVLKSRLRCAPLSLIPVEPAATGLVLYPCPLTTCEAHFCQCLSVSVM